MDASYNDINEWNYKGLVDVFGGGAKSKKFVVKTKDEVEDLFKDPDFNAAQALQFVEIHMPKEDAPRALIKTAEASAKVNSRTE
jgi:pyruvate decarboxylase